MLVLVSAPYTSSAANSSVVAKLSHQFPTEKRKIHSKNPSMADQSIYTQVYKLSNIYLYVCVYYYKKLTILFA